MSPVGAVPTGRVLDWLGIRGSAVTDLNSRMPVGMSGTMAWEPTYNSASQYTMAGSAALNAASQVHHGQAATAIVERSTRETANRECDRRTVTRC